MTREPLDITAVVRKRGPGANSGITWKQLTTRIPDEVHRALKIRAAEEGRSVAVIVEELIRRYLTEEVRP